ncbi:S-layer homology domain-containing protein [Brevibacillus sp. HB1.3]|uniref:S-layer homology domain-containing protein n=1 Tax=Brevibacillus sp. HB1.3 TaxID=2738842 RepID=UPI001552A4C7|nr:S-layer homology domain-containing protein [Brevibacillus sp. HB1.3]NQF13316.1 S-layer homology domain-containing protein [Brevibacillus sp. HB1.3]
MGKKVFRIMIAIALLFTMLPLYPVQVDAAWGDNNKNQKNFVFPDVVAKVNYKYVTLQGVLSNVSPNGITYSVKNTAANIETTPSSRGITVSQDGARITVANIELFDGDNTVTFYGKQGTSEVINTYEITYISTPLLYNLQLTGGGKKLPINPNDNTIVTRDFSTSNYFTIEGNSPNVTQVIIRNGSESVSTSVSPDADAYFIVGRVPLKRGLNKLTFLLKNDNQTVEVKRNVVYFDGTGTFYDVQMQVNTEKYQLADNPTVKTNADAAARKGAKFSGYVIIPKEPRLTSFNPANPGTTQIVKVDMLNTANRITESVPSITSQFITQTGTYAIYSFESSGTSLSDNMIVDNQRVYAKLSAFSPIETYKSDPSNATPPAVYDDPTDDEFGYLFQSANAPSITKLEYKFGTSSVYNDLKDGTILNEKPFYIKMLVSNGANNAGIKVESVNSYGNKSVVIPSSITPVGASAEYVLKIDSLPFDGTQTLTVYYDANTFASVKVNAAAGPVLKMDGVYDGLIFKYDPNLSNSDKGYATREGNTKYLIEDILKEFSGRLDNVNVVADDYKDSNGKKAITLKVNNNEVILAPTDASSPNSFKMTVDGNQTYKKVSGYFHDGQNTVIFKYNKNNLVYEKTLIVTLYSNSVPEIPVANTEIYPYNTTTRKPDSRFVGKDGVYTTKENKMKITGTFDFVDLGDKESEVNSTIGYIEANKYVFVIEGPDGFGTKTWDLKTNTLMNDNKPFDNNKTDITDLDVYYDMKKHYFTFDIDEQDIPTDGSKAVYKFTVYNNGVNGGSKASYRLEVSAPGVTYKILRPTPLQKTVNQNYIEVVIESKNSSKVTVGKTEAQKISFDSDLDGDIDTTDAYRAIFTDLKPGKANKIPITITRGADTVKDTIEVFYAPTNIQGAQHMAPMDKIGKVFGGKVALTFPKETYLMRTDYTVPENLRGQVFKGHNILFGIANTDDGVLDRYDYLEDRPRNFDDTVQDLGRQFKNSFDMHFIKASNVFWIDAGMADNPNTDEYDPYQYGMLPIMAIPDPDEMNPRLYNFNDVPRNRVVMPTKRGTLELSFDEHVVPDASHTLTVMRYDPEKFYWENLGGVVNTSKKTIKVPFDRFGYYVVAKLNDSFRDVVHHPYARNHMEAMFAKGVVRARSSLDFAPDMDTTRGEFAAMVVRALELPLVTDVSKPSFDDVIMDYSPTDLYDYRHIETAARLGIVKGTDPRIFNPQGKVTRQEAAVILSRALKLKLGTSAPASKLALKKQFKDFNLIDDYAAPAVVAVAKAKLIAGSPVDVEDLKKGYVFEPNANILRGDAAILMSRVMANQKKIPPVLEIKL